MMDWHEVKQEILDQIDENWLKEPEAMWKVRHGINVTGAGSFNQYLSTMMFVDVYTIAYGPEVKKFAKDIDAVLNQLQTKEEYKELIGAYDRYINLIHYWHHCTFPWHVGLMYQYKSANEIDMMQKLAHS